MNSDFRFGIEEEFFVGDRAKRDAGRTKTKDFIASCKAEFRDAVQTEMLEAQIEVATPPLTDCGEARDFLRMIRAGVGRHAAKSDLVVLAAGTHPLAHWNRQKATAQPRASKLMHDLQMLGARNMVCGLHVHVETPSGVSRVDLMNRVMPYLPLLLALSTSSPFWQGQRTGLMGYRLAAYRELPRTGLPDLFEGEEDYKAYIDTLMEARAIENSSFVWWVVRPSLAHPTLELRVADSCTRLDDTLAITALFRSLVRRLCLDPALNAGMTGASRAIVAENCWRAQRYGIHGSFVDAGARRLAPVRDVLEETLALVAEDARELGCAEDLAICREILTRGTSADAQLSIFTEATGRGLASRDALMGVVDWLAGETTGGVDLH
jgi:carboxylate-amine ligase